MATKGHARGGVRTSAWQKMLAILMAVSLGLTACAPAKNLGEIGDNETPLSATGTEQVAEGDAPAEEAPAEEAPAADEAEAAPAEGQDEGDPAFNLSDFMGVAGALNGVTASAMATDTMTVYYGFTEIKPATSKPSSITNGTKLLFVPASVTPVSATEAFLGLPSGCGMMVVDTSTTHKGSGTFIAHVTHPATTVMSADGTTPQKTANTKAGFDGCNGSFDYYNDATYWHYWCDGGGVKNASFRIYKYTEATVNKSALQATTKTKKEVSSTDIHIPKNELAVTLTVNNQVFNIDEGRWSFVDDKVNYVNNDRQITIQFGTIQASCNVEFYGSEPDPHAYKTVARDADVTGNLKVGETLHYNVKVTNEATTGSIWKNVTIVDTLPFGMELVQNSVKLARTQAANAADKIPSIPLSEAKYNYDAKTRTMTLEIPYYVLNNQAYELTYDVKIAATAIAGGEAGGSNETRNLTNTVNVNGYDSDGKAYPCKPTACLPIPGETNPDNIKVEQIVPGSENDPEPDPKKENAIEYLEHSKTAENTTDTRPGAVTQVWDVIKYTMTMENNKAGAVFRDGKFVDHMPEGLEIILNDANYPMKVTKTATLEDDRQWSEDVTGASYEANTRTITVPCGDMFYGERAELTFYAQVTPAALGGDIGNMGTIEAAAPTTPGNEEAVEVVVDDNPEPTYPEPEKDKPQPTEVEVPVIDPETGEQAVDPETGEPLTETKVENTGGVAACNPEPHVEKTIAVVGKKPGVEVTDANRDTPQVGDTVRTTVVISNLKEGSDWVNVVVNDSCSDVLDLIPESVRVFDADGNDVTEQFVTVVPGTQDIKLSFPSLVGGDTYTLQYDARVSSAAISLTGAQPNITDPVKVVGDSPDQDEEDPVDVIHTPKNMARPGDPLDTINKTMKMKERASANEIQVGDIVQYTIVAGNVGDTTTQALNPVVLDPLPEGIELTSQYVYVTKMTFNERTEEWEKASPSYVRKIARSNVYNEAARTLVVAVGEVTPGSNGDRICQGQTGYMVDFECKVTHTAFASSETMGNIAYSDSEKPSEKSQPADDPTTPDTPATQSDEPTVDPKDPTTWPVDDDGDIVKPDGTKVTDPEGNPIKPSDTKGDHPTVPDDEIGDYIKKQIEGDDPVPPAPKRPTYPTDKDGDIINQDGEKVRDPEGKPIKPTDTLEDHPSIPLDDIDEFIQNPTDKDGNPTVDPTDPTAPIGAEPVRDPMRPVYPVDDDGDIVMPDGKTKVLDPEGNPIKNTDREKDHPSIPDESIDEYIQKQIEPLPRPYPTDADGDVVTPVFDPETGDPVVDPDTGEPVYEKVLDVNGEPVKPDNTEVLEDLDIPRIMALHQVVKEVTKLAEDKVSPAGKVTYDSGKTGADRVTTEDDTSYGPGDIINTKVTVKNLVKGTRWSGAVVIDMPSNLVVTYYELVGPFDNGALNSWGTKGEYGSGVAAVQAATFNAMPFATTLGAETMTVTQSPANTLSTSVARLTFNGSQFRLSASEIIGLEQYEIYYEGYVPETVKPGTLEEMVQEQPPTSTNPMDTIVKEGPQVPANTPEGAKIDPVDPAEQPTAGDTPSLVSSGNPAEIIPDPIRPDDDNNNGPVKAKKMPPVLKASKEDIGKGGKGDVTQVSDKGGTAGNGWGTDVTTRLLQLAQTGDTLFMAMASLALLAAGAAIVLLVSRQRSKREQPIVHRRR